MEAYDLTCLESKDPQVKYGMQKKILALSHSSPENLYPDFDFFVGLLDSTNNILQWTGILVLGNLARVDRHNKIEAVLPRLVSKLNAGKMITAGNTIKSLVEIACAKPELADLLAAEIIKVRDYHYDTPECKSIAAGHALKNITGVWGLLSPAVQEQVLQFARSELASGRPATAKKAQNLLNKYAAA
jgi:hypothetical protein